MVLHPIAEKQSTCTLAVRHGRWLCGGVIACVALLLAAGCSPRGGGAKAEAPLAPAGVIPIQIEWPDAESIRMHGFYGFNVYRGADREGPFVKINDDPIVPSPENPQPEFVVFFDRGLEPGQTLYYYIETVYLDGRTQKVTPATPKLVTQEMTAEELAVWQKQREAGREGAAPSSKATPGAKP